MEESSSELSPWSLLAWDYMRAAGWDLGYWNSTPEGSMTSRKRNTFTAYYYVTHELGKRGKLTSKGLNFASESRIIISVHRKGFKMPVHDFMLERSYWPLAKTKFHFTTKWRLIRKLKPNLLSCFIRYFEIASSRVSGIKCQERYIQYLLDTNN